MTQAEIDRVIQKMEEYRKSIRTDKQKAKQALQRAGILDRSGKLAKPYC